MTRFLNINSDAVQIKLIGFINNQVSRAGFSRAVVGLSGGVDSAIACYLAAGALGPEDVLAVRMPYRTSSPDSLEHAQLIIDELGVQSLTVPITKMVEPIFERFSDADEVRRGNIMARSRMIVLYDQSAAFNGLVVGTGNKTEILLGYSTLYGDSACALNPLGDLYKTQVRQLARHMGVPEGFTYDEVDKLFYLLFEERRRPEECVEAGFEREFVRVVVDRVRRNHFKRVMPPIARLSDRNTGFDLPSLRDGES